MSSKSENKLVSLPTENELLEIGRKVEKTITSRGQLLIVIDGLKLDDISLSEKMVYVLSLISLGFDEGNAIKRLDVRPIEFEAWKNDDYHKKLYNKALSKAEMFLEEKVLSEADVNPKLAFELLKERKRAKEKEQKVEDQQAGDVWELVSRGREERDVQDGELIDDTLE